MSRQPAGNAGQPVGWLFKAVHGASTSRAGGFGKPSYSHGKPLFKILALATLSLVLAFTSAVQAQDSGFYGSTTYEDGELFGREPNIFVGGTHWSILDGSDSFWNNGSTLFGGQFGATRTHGDRQMSFQFARRLWLTNDMILGLGAGYDITESPELNVFQQAVISGEILLDEWSLRTNVNLPVGPRVRNVAQMGSLDDELRYQGNNIIFGTEFLQIDEAAMKGAELELAHAIGNWSGEIYGMAYRYLDRTGADMWGGGGGIRGYVAPALAANIEITSDSLFGTNVYGGFTCFFGGPGGNAPQTIEDKLTIPIERSRQVIVNRVAQQINTLQLLTRNGAPITVMHIDDNAADDDLGEPESTFENPHNSLTAGNTDANKNNFDIVFTHADTMFNGQVFSIDADGQRFLGESATDFHSVVADQGTFVLPRATAGPGNRPQISGAGLNLITLNANQVEVSAVDLSGAQTGIISPNVLRSQTNINRIGFVNNVNDIVIPNSNETTISEITSVGATGGSIQLGQTAGITLLQNADINGAGGGTGGLQFDNTQAGAQVTLLNVTIDDGAGSTNGLSVLNDQGGRYNIQNLDVDGIGGIGVNVDNASGAGFIFDGASSITNVGGISFNLTNSSALVTYNGDITHNSAAAMVNIQNHTGTVTFQNGMLAATNGTGLQFDNADGIYNFNGTTTLNGGDAGIDIIGSSGQFTFANADITDPSGTAFNVDGGSANVTYSGGSISQANNATTVNVQNGHTGTLNFGIDIMATNGNGLQFNNADGTYNFNLMTGMVALSGGDAGIDIIGNSDGIFTFADTSITNPTGVAVNIGAGSGLATFGNLDINQAVGGGLVTSGFGLVTVQGGEIDGVTGDGISAVNNSLIVGTIAPSGVIFGANSPITGDAIQVDNTDGINRIVTILNNTSLDTADIGGSAISLSSTGTGTLTATVDGNDMKSTNAAFLASSGANTDSMRLALNANTWERGTNGFTVSVTGGAVSDEIFITSLSSGGVGNTVIGNNVGGGMSFNCVTFDADPDTAAFDQVAGGTTNIGQSTAARVEGDGLSLIDVSGNLDFATLNIFNQNGDGLVVDTKTKGTTFTLTGGGSGTIDTDTGNPLNLDPLSTDLTFGNVTGTGGGVIIDTVDAVGGPGSNALTIGTLDITGAPTAGIDISNSTGTFTFGSTGGSTIDNSASAGVGVSIVNTTPGDMLTVNFNNGLDVDTTTGVGFSVNGVGNAVANTTVNVTGDATESINTTSGQAIDIDTATLGISFDNVTSSGSGAEGIDIDSAAGSFTVTGLTDIDNATTSGIDIDSSAGTFTFANVDIDGTGADGITLSGNSTTAININGGAIDDTTGDGINSTNTSGLTIDGIAFGNTTAIGGDAIEIVNSDATNRSVTLQNNTSSATADITGRGIFLNSSGTGTLTATVSGNNLQATDHALETADAGTLGSLVIAVDNNTFQTGTGVPAVEMVGTNINTTQNSTVVTSLSGNTITANGTGGGMFFNNVTFDGDGVAGGAVTQVAGGATNIGANFAAPAAGDRVQGDGLSFLNPTGDISFGTLNIANNGGTGLKVIGASAAPNTTFNLASLSGSPGVIDTTGGAAMSLDPLTTDLNFNSVTSADSPTFGILIDSLADGSSLTIGTTTINDANPGAGLAGLTIQNNTGTVNLNFGNTTIDDTDIGNGATGDGLLITGNSAGTTSTFGDLTITTDNGTGMTHNDGSTVTVTGTTTITANSPGMDLQNSTGTLTFADLNVNFTGATRGIDFRNSTVNFDANNTTITGDGTAGSIGIDLAGSMNPNGANSMTSNIRLADAAGQTAIINNVDTGVLLGDGAGSAGAFFVYGNQTEPNSGSQINVIAGGTTLDTTNLISTDPFTQGRYEFRGVSFTGAASFESAGDFYFVADTATGAGDGSSVDDRADAAQLLTDLGANNLANRTVVGINDGADIDFGAATANLNSMTNIDGFGNGNTIVQFTVPVNVIVTEANLQNDPTLSDPTGNGAATFTADATNDVFNLEDTHTISNVNIAGGDFNIAGTGFENLTVQGVGLGGGNSGVFAFSNTINNGTIQLTDNTINQDGGRLLEVDGGNSVISLAAGTGAVSNTNGSGIDIRNTTGGSVMIDNVSITSADATPLTFDNNDATFSITNNTISTDANVTLLDIDTTAGGSTTALTFDNTNTFTHNSGTIADIGSGARNIDLSAHNFTNTGTTSANVINSTGQTGGTISFGNVTVNSFNNAAGTAVNLQGTGGTVTFTDLDIATTAGAGLNVGGITFAAGASPTINAAGANALTMNGTTLSGGAETFDSITSSGGATGISLTNVTGSTTFTTVDIDNSTTNGVSLSGAGTVAINGGTIDGTTVDGINSANTNLTVASVNLGGNTVIGGDGIQVVNTVNSTLAINDSTVNATGAGVTVDGSGGGTTTVTSLSGNTVTNAGAGGMLFETVTFDAGSGADVAGGNTTIGNIASTTDVTGDGLRLNNVLGGISFGTLNIGNDNGTGLFIRDHGGKAGTFAFSNTGGTINTTNGAAMDIDPVAMDSTFASVFSTNGTNGILLDTVDAQGGAGSNALTVGTVNITGSTSAGIDIQSSTGTFTFGSTGGTTIDNSGSAGGGVSIANTAADTTAVNFNGGLNIDTTTGTGFGVNGVGGTATTVNVTATDGDESINSTMGQAVEIDTATLGIAFDSVSSAGSTAEGVEIDNAAGTFTASGGSITTATGTAFAADGGNAALTYNGNITNTAGESIEVLNRTGGAVAFGGTVNDTGTGMTFTSNTGGSTTFTGNVTINTGANIAVDVNSSAGHGVNFDGATTDIDTTTMNAIDVNAGGTLGFGGTTATVNATSGRGFNAAGGGTTTVTGNAQITTTTGRGVNIDGTTIGAGGVTFRSVSVDGADNGIVLNGTGTTGFFTITGDGSMTDGLLDRDGSGGTINTTGTAVSLTNANNVTLRQMNLDSSNAATDVIGSSGGGTFTFSAIEIMTPTGDGWDADNLTGVNRWDNNSLISGVNVAATSGIIVTNTNTNLTSLTIDQSTFNNSTGGQGMVVMQGSGTSVMTLNVTDANTANSVDTTFENLNQSAIITDAGVAAASTATVTTNISDTMFINGPVGGFNNVEIQATENGTANFNISNNTFQNLDPPGANSGILLIQATTNGTLGAAPGGTNGLISGNTFDQIDGRRGIHITSNGNSSDHNILVQNNAFTDLEREALFVSARDNTVDFDIEITGNTFGTAAAPVGNTDREAVQISSENSAQLDVLYTNNDAVNTGMFDPTFRAESLDDATLNLTVTMGNTFRNLNASGEQFIVESANVTGPILCLNLNGNDSLSSAGASGGGTFELIETAGDFNVVDRDNTNANNTGTVNFTPGIGSFDDVMSCPLPDLNN